MTHTPENLLTVWADALMSALADAGVREIVASPGSRNTPYLLAALRESRLSVVSIVDERAASFFALGRARVTGRPPALLCTSGSAPAHYFPAVIEASEASLPLVVIGADRPRELIGAGAPQATEQHRLYGPHARAFADLGEPHPKGLRGMRRTAADLVARALGPDPGPVQLNAPARKPLEPTDAITDAGRALAEAYAGLPAASLAQPTTLSIDDGLVDEIAAALSDAERPAIVAGPTRGPAPAALALCRRHGVALLSEATSQLRYLDRDGVLAADGFGHWIERGDPRPDLVLEIGQTPTSGEYGRWLGQGGPARRYVVGGTRFRDPHGTAARVVLGPTDALLAAIDARATPKSRDGWAQTVRAHEARAAAAIEKALAEPGFTEIHAARAVVDALPEGVRLALGNSLPIRTVDRFAPASGATLDVLSARGVNGIDGWIAGSIGAAIDAPVCAIVGDVTAAHDIGSLQLAALARAPVAIVVLDNAGGRIFAELPIVDQVDDATFDRFLTPPRLDLELAAQALGAQCSVAEDEASVKREVREALSTPGVSLVWVRVAEDGARTVLRRVREEMA